MEGAAVALSNLLGLEVNPQPAAVARMLTALSELELVHEPTPGAFTP